MIKEWMNATPPSDRAGLRWWQNLAAAGLLPAVGAQFAVNLYVHNAEELRGGPALLAPGLLACLALWATLFALLHWGRAVGRCVWLLATAYAAFLLVREFAFPLPLGELDGDGPLPTPTAGYLAAEAATLAIALGVLWLARFRLAPTLAGMAACVFTLFTLATACQHPELLAAPPGAPEASPLSIPNPSGAGTDRPNIYHVLFDQYSGVEHRWERQGRGVAPFDDFVCFANNISNYNRTSLSVPSLFTGVDYTPDQQSKDWDNLHQSAGLLKDLKQSGYGIQIYGLDQQSWTSPYTDYVRCTSAIIDERSARRKDPELRALLELRTLPSWIGIRRYEAMQRTRDASEPPPVAWPYYCTLKFREMVASIHQTPARGNYMFIHMILPHGPRVMNANAEYVGMERATRMDQIRCAEKLLGELVAELKRLGRYDDSLIVVHGDTGKFADPDLSTQEEKNGSLRNVSHCKTDAEKRDGALWPVELVRAHANSAFLIKPPRHRGYRVEYCPSQLKDLPPTVLALAGIGATDHQYGDGCDLFSNPPGPDRVRKTFVLGMRIGGQVVRHLQEYRVVNGEFERNGLVPFDCK